MENITYIGMYKWTCDPVARLLYNMVIFMDIKNRIFKSEWPRIAIVQKCSLPVSCL